MLRSESENKKNHSYFDKLPIRYLWPDRGKIPQLFLVFQLLSTKGHVTVLVKMKIHFFSGEYMCTESESIADSSMQITNLIYPHKGFHVKWRILDHSSLNFTPKDNLHLKILKWRFLSRHHSYTWSMSCWSFRASISALTFNWQTRRWLLKAGAQPCETDFNLVQELPLFYSNIKRFIA